MMSMEQCMCKPDLIIASAVLKNPAQCRMLSSIDKKENHLKVELKLEMNRVQTRKYPNVRTGDEANIYCKKMIGEKERTSNWSSSKYKVTGVEKNSCVKSIIPLKGRKDPT